MAFLTDEQVAAIKEHMCCDEKALSSKYKFRKKTHEECSVSFNEAETLKTQGRTYDSKDKSETSEEKGCRFSL